MPSPGPRLIQASSRCRIGITCNTFHLGTQVAVAYACEAVISSSGCKRVTPKLFAQKSFFHWHPSMPSSFYKGNITRARFREQRKGGNLHLQLHDPRAAQSRRVITKKKAQSCPAKLPLASQPRIPVPKKSEVANTRMTTSSRYVVFLECARFTCKNHARHTITCCLPKG
jgi:hypothetical protein